MFDMHFDLLSIAYKSYLEKDFTFLEEWCKYYNENNILGVVANLYFMSEKEMKEELHPNYYQKDVSVVEMFRISKEIVERYLPDTEIVYSIEGCDYLDVAELDELYNLGLRNILPVWNEKNRYASGNRSSEGLTDEGRKLLDKAIELGISIDLSHANTRSFFDILEYLKEKNANAIVIASHSNARSLCDVTRNLTDEQLYALKEVNGLVGVFSNRNFIVERERKDFATKEEQRDAYLNHINHISSIVGVDNVVLATDDMMFLKDIDVEYGRVPVYDYNTITNDLINDLAKYYTEDETEKLLYRNAKEKYYNLVLNEKERRI